MTATTEPKYFVIGPVLETINNAMLNEMAPPYKIGMSSSVKELYDSEVEQMKHDKQFMQCLGYVDIIVDDELGNDGVYLLA